MIFSLLHFSLIFIYNQYNVEFIISVFLLPSQLNICMLSETRIIQVDVNHYFIYPFFCKLGIRRNKKKVKISD